MKRLIGILLVAAVVVTMIVVAGAAETEKKIVFTADAAEVKAGDIVTVTLSLEGFEDCDTFMFYDPVYNEDALEWIGGEWMIDGLMSDYVMESIPVNDVEQGLSGVLYAEEAIDLAEADVATFEFEVLQETGLEEIGFNVIAKNGDAVLSNNVEVVPAEVTLGAEAAQVYTCNFNAIEVSYEAEVELRLKFFIPEELINDDEAYAVLTLNGKETIVTMPELREDGKDSKGRYILRQGIASGRMTQDVDVQIIDGQGNIADLVDYIDGSTSKTITRSVLDYARLALEKGTAAQKSMVTSLLVYGGYSQGYFNIEKDNPAYNLLKEFDIAIPTLDDISADSITQELTKSNTDIGITQTTQQAYLDSAIYHRVYFVLDEGASIDDYSFVMTYTSNYVEKTKDVLPVYEESRDRYYVDILDIPAPYLDYMYKITVTNNNTNETYEVSTSVMAWVKLLLQKSTNEAQIKMGKALYYYNQEANAFFNK